MKPTPALPLSRYPIINRDTLRFADTDKQGHVNNAVFSTFLESGRVQVLYAPEPAIHPEGTQFVIARLEIDYLNEIIWPGEVVCGTAVLSVSHSSMRLVQTLYQNNTPVAHAESVIVLTNTQTRRSCPLSEESKQRLLGWQLKTV